jgi:hypothetical protein
MLGFGRSGKRCPSFVVRRRAADDAMMFDMGEENQSE